MPVKQTTARILKAPAAWAVVVALATTLVAGSTGTASAAPVTPSSSPSASPSASGPGAAPAPPSPAQQLTWSVQPSSQKKPDGRASFTYQDFAPGSSHEDFIAVDNFSATAKTFTVYASDAFNTAVGGFDLLAAADKPKDVGTWVHLAEPTVRIPARSSVIVPFTVTVPQNATPGFHVGGIVASSSSSGTGADGSRVQVDRRVGVRIYLQVTGPLRPSLQVENLSVQYHDSWNPTHPGSATVSYTLANNGNVPLQGHQTLHSAGLFGVFGKNLAVPDAPLLLPGNSIRMTIEVPRVWPGARLTAGLHVTPFTNVTTLLQPAAAVTVSGSAWAMPWIWLAALIVLALAWYRRKRRLRKAARAAQKPVAAAEKTPAATSAGGAGGS